MSNNHARQARIHSLHEAIKQRILILDGAMGTMIQSYKLQEADYRGERFANYHMDIAGVTICCLLLSRTSSVKFSRLIWMLVQIFWKPTPSTPHAFPWLITTWRDLAQELNAWHRQD